MAKKNYIRAPFAAAAAEPAHYTVTADFDAARRATVQVNGEAADRLKLEPVFPGKLTFKPSDPATVPDDPTKADPPVAVKGDLFLELPVTPEGTELAAAARSLNVQGLLFAYLGVTLTSGFFTGTVLEALKKPKGTGFQAVKVDGDTLTTGPRIAKAFAQGRVTVDLKAAADGSGYAFPTLVKDATTKLGEVTLAVGTRVEYDPYASSPTLNGAAQTTATILAAPRFVPMPLAFFFRVLRELPGWGDLAVAGHAAHKFFAALDASEAAARWRRVRVFKPGPRGAASEPLFAFQGLSARARSTAKDNPQLWSVPLDRLGQAYVKRADGETFLLDLRSGTSSLPVSPGPDDPRAPQLSATWPAAAARAEASGIDVTADLPLTDDALTAGKALEMGFRDDHVAGGKSVHLGLTLDPRNKQVVHTRELVLSLQQALRDAGFGIDARLNGEYDEHTRHAVREFQREARTNARVKAGAAVDPATVVPFAGAVTGRADTGTLAELRLWRDNGWRSPFAYEVRKKDGTFLQDVSFASADLADAVVSVNGARVGTVADNGKGIYNTTGLDVLKAVTDAATAAQFAGATWEKRAISSVAVSEGGKFETMNTYDSAYLSLGFFQWTIGESRDQGELVGIAAPIPPVAPDTNPPVGTLLAADFARLFTPWGLALNRVKRGTSMVDEISGQFGRSVVRSRFALDGVGMTSEEKEEFRGFRWARRFRDVGADTAFRQAMWAHARARIEIVLNLRIPFGGTTIPARDLLQTEMMVALALDQHVNRPAHVDGALGDSLAALANPDSIWAESPPPDNLVAVTSLDALTTWEGKKYDDLVAARKRTFRTKRPLTAQEEIEVQGQLAAFVPELQALREQAAAAILRPPLATPVPPRIDPATGKLTTLTPEQRDAFLALYKWHRENLSHPRMTHADRRWNEIVTSSHTGKLGPLLNDAGVFTP